ncbi:MAG: dihydropteroate synthase [Caldilineales bacterium]
METILQSPTRTVVIGPGKPFVIIGERINPTGRKKLAAEMAAGDFSRVIADAKAQVEAGAHVLDVNSGVPLTDEAELMTEAVRLVQQTVDAPISIDSSVVAALKAGLKAATGKPWSTRSPARTSGLRRSCRWWPSARGRHRHQQRRNRHLLRPARALQDCEEDRRARRKLRHPREDVLIDPLAMPVGAVQGAGKHLFDIVRMVREELGCNTICGASNISFGLPNRPILNATFVAMAIAAGMPCAITNPLDHEIRQAILAADVMMGADENCAAWITAQRQAAASDAPAADAAAPSEASGREARRAAREARRAAAS